jgi:hypothetical protein
VTAWLLHELCSRGPGLCCDPREIQYSDGGQPSQPDPVDCDSPPATLQTSMQMTNQDSAIAGSLGATPTVSRNDVVGAVMDLARMAQGLADARSVPGLSLAIVHRDELVHLASEEAGAIKQEARRLDGIAGAAALIRRHQAQRVTPACLAAVRRGLSLQPSTSLRRCANSRYAAS